MDTIASARARAPARWTWAAVGRSLRSAFAVPFSTTLTWLERSRSRRQLSGLDDRILSDIGLTRADVWEEARKPFFRS